MELGQIATVLNQKLSFCQEIIEGSSVLPQVSEIEAVKYMVGLGFHMLFESRPVFVEFVCSSLLKFQVLNKSIP